MAWKKKRLHKLPFQPGNSQSRIKKEPGLHSQSFPCSTRLPGTKHSFLVIVNHSNFLLIQKRN